MLDVGHALMAVETFFLLDPSLFVELVVRIEHPVFAFVVALVADGRPGQIRIDAEEGPVGAGQGFIVATLKPQVMAGLAGDSAVREGVLGGILAFFSGLRVTPTGWV
ncbi:hypothetical protein GF1_26760 [Desulfolithobacter dissulfuricans]|uniref:Uncharacterized protein n=1 Tax=Desulfolithobacter dissulfuricans TaxID=2795293 RepID=A0A915XJH4_9BACT|nr:hypothetical protein GF1_26760 [Desulfolithobacter dissulfuricans]